MQGSYPFDFIVHIFVFLVMFAAAIMAIYIIPLAKKTAAWLFLSVAFILFALERMLELLIHQYAWLELKNYEILSDLLFLITSALSLIGIMLIRKIFIDRNFVFHELTRNLDELKRIHSATIGRELRNKELFEENQSLRILLGQQGISLTSGLLGKNIDQTISDSTSTSDMINERTALLFMLEDLERSKQEIESAHSEWINALDVVNDPIFLHDKEFCILRCNLAYQQLAGIPFKKIIGQRYYEIFPKLNAPSACCLKALKTVGKDLCEEDLILGDKIYRSRAFAVSDELGNYRYSVHTLEDITERKQIEVDIEHSSRAITTLGAVNHELVHSTNEGVLLLKICEAITDHGGYKMAWVGYTKDDDDKSIDIMASSNQIGTFPDSNQVSWAENKYGMGPIGRAVRSGKTQTCQDIANDLNCEAWRDIELKQGFASSIALPLKRDDLSVFGILKVYSDEVNAFTAKEIVLLEEMAGDMAFGVRSLHISRDREVALNQIKNFLIKQQKSLEDTVQAIAKLAEMRDPYTAGHQIRVAELATAIAKHMGLAKEEAHGISLAGKIHDLGKIQVPAELLSKPGKITDIEFSLIKIHSQSGYDILKDIDFPWPIAQMVLQHHERIDGSGYPQGLKGEDILLGARILGVADVVEAISAHRPYRPGLGVDVALEEISKMRGIQFDPAVVDACIALFHEENFAFTS